MCTASESEVRKVTDKPLLFNQIAGGKSPRVTLTELREAGAELALYSTPCLFAAQTAIDERLPPAHTHPCLFGG